MMQSSAQVATERGGRYLGQLCSHFGHKLPTERSPDDSSGEIRFPFGLCRMSADAAGLTLRVEAEDSEALTRMEEVMERHLARFAFREPAAIAWVRAAA